MIAIKVPPLGESIVEATVSRWLKQEGDAVTAGETLVELETDKITVEVPALKAGVLSVRARAEGDVVAVDDILGQLDETGAAAPLGEVLAAATDGDSGHSAGEPPSDPAVSATERVIAPAVAPEAAVTKSAPAARRTADEAGLDISSVTGTGRGGVISKPDVVDAIASAAASATAPPVAPAVPVAPVASSTPAAPSAPAAPAAPAPSAPAASSTPVAPVRTGGRETREKMTTRRKRIAENLLQAQANTAHLTTFNEIDMSATTALRARIKDKVEKEHGVKLSFMPFFVKAASHALKAFPLVNAQLDGDSIVFKHYVNMGIAVASDAGLVVPNVKDADTKGMLTISRDIAALATRARNGKLAMDDLTGGTFTITNGGVFGSLISTPIINYPQVAILGLHKTQDRPVAIDGKVEIRPMMYVALSYDHRIIDGQQAVLFLVRIKELMEDPASMLVD
ncbi:MAG: 2-oxoglutarate dehydrogenase complex dihydrolipoyllysine-residue succinyltransferase [Gemmatimonadaceae bacterium]|nr:2-oxoglutarate dehydrogenase complex dihydrolipoyllysine-residue succinyltransferase [Gemmatimonadaceae bacterium]